ncbi:uncharacterized protein OCT59_027322 [Rhizophagus irregularis]|uniref:Uncharacterized protein n=2 Tax=Rhizophagus irregularis TaxID=588596 RepID=U9ST56_RHIID|nr:hypothetical protein GLOIN_2v1837634 [Rhizophagus irregularis DAOM 181602=DAOM 197198]EXX53879.1 hypothetical protein RirG_239790 [Rhizophagus irregularis DAOM 197198w]POG77203.1 hypothetical protein GLOIN_2v1837634 [Rhizophagus irregularis DAOM 181602=DAOM 197198]UZO07018.1 hypothetical protein OCT59_027322 [Rhizophagus irregularis]GBC45162.1 hypothetical protein GLOIN_2v1837634 [Rhizophagus irregularis DAOM 181602=DAOM 197198]|eukprot:XP_025184069.1 hypothetical protein GLOIN_2v1837634 [Rhizophagus irregularis DAOM 181602=DAOM 197198]
MNSNNQNTQDYYNLQTDQTENSPSPQQISNNNNNNENIQHTLINNVGVSNTNLNTLHINTINSTTLAPNNTTFEFYFYLPNDTRIYRVTYSELNPSENVQILNNRINLSHVPDYQLPYHYNVQSLIRQQIQQQVQHPIVYQQDNIQQQYFDTTQPTSQVYSNNDTYNTTSISVDGTVSYDMGNMGFQNSP